MPEHPTTPAPGPQPGTGSDPQEVHGGGHGTSAAAWISTLGVSFGALVVCVALIFMWVPVIIVGAVVIVLAALSAPVLVRAGYGEQAHNREVTGGPRAVR